MLYISSSDCCFVGAVYSPICATLVSLTNTAMRHCYRTVKFPTRCRLAFESPVILVGFVGPPMQGSRMIISDFVWAKSVPINCTVAFVSVGVLLTR